MRSRTELVTTTFVDSEEDYSDDDDDSEEDWQPTASNKNGKKSKQSYQQQIHHQQQQQQQRNGSGGSGGNGSNTTSSKRGRKRKGSSNKSNVAKRRISTNNDFSDLVDKDEISDEISDDDFHTKYELTNENMAGPSSQKKSSTISIPNESSNRQFSENKTTTSLNDSCSHNKSPSHQNDDNLIDVLIYIKDLMGDYKKNQRLCLWRKDDTNLLQKYIRVKTSPEEFLFTSSSVYSSWDDNRVTDFLNIKVQTLDNTNRRVKINDLEELAKLAQQAKNSFNHDQNETEHKLDFECNKDVANSSIESNNKLFDNGNKNNKNIGNQKYAKQNATKILEKMHQQSTIDEDKDYDNDDVDDDDDDDDEEEVEEENDEEEDEGDLEADDDDDDDIEEDENEDDLEGEDEGEVLKNDN